MEFSDETLVKQALSGNTDSFSILVKKYQGAVFALAFSMTKSVEDARDLTQESFIKAYVNLPTLREPSKFAAWLKRITWSTCTQWFRDTANRRSLLARMPKNSPKTPEDLVLEKELREIISTALDTLPEKLRLTTLLYYTDGLSYQEIASFQEVPVTTVKSRLYESRKRLKAMLSKEVIPIMKDVLKSQAPKEDFPDKIMEILSKMEDSAKAIKSAQFTVEDHFGGWVYYTQVAYSSPNLWRVESDNVVFVCNGEKIWRYDKTWKLVYVSTVGEPDRPILPQWWHSGIGFRMSLERKDATVLGLSQYIPQWHFIFTRDNIDPDYELKLEEWQERYILRMTKPKRDVRDRAYFYPRQLTETPKRKLFSEEIFRQQLPGPETTFYSFFTWEIPPAKSEMILLGIDARTYLPLLQEGDYQFGKIEVKGIAIFGKEGIIFPTEFRLLNGKGERHFIRYTDIHINEDIASDRFSFDIPQDVVIINDDDYKDIEASIARYEEMLNQGNLDRTRTIRCLYALSDLYYHRKFGQPQENHTKTAELLERICQIESSIPIVHWSLFMTYRSLYFKLGKLEEIWQKGLEALEMGAKYAPHPLHLKELAIHSASDRQQSHIAKALEYQKRLLELCDSRRKIAEADDIWCYALDAGISQKSLIPLYEAKLSSEPNEPYLWKLLGTLYCQTGETDKAAPYLKRYIQWRKEHMLAQTLNSFEDREIKVTGLLLELADLYQTRLQYISEEMIGIDFIETKSGMPTLTALLEIYFRLLDFPKLDSVFRQICRYGARAGFALDRFAAGNSAVGLTEEEAWQTLDNMKQLSQDAILWVFMGDFCRDAYRIDFKQGAYVTMDDMGDAEGFYKRAIELDDKEPIAYAALGDLYFSQKKYQDAAEAYERASELAPAQPYFVAQLAHSYSGMGKHESAIQVAKQLTKRMPDDKDAHRVLGVVYFNTSRYEEAIEQFQPGLDDEDIEKARSVSMTPEKVIVYLLARAYDHAERYEESKSLIDKMRKRT